jgi:hypothetical protein
MGDVSQPQMGHGITPMEKEEHSLSKRREVTEMNL